MKLLRPSYAESTPHILAVTVILFVVAIYLPFAGRYGLGDPWETHYGEVARQMVQRSDFIRMWWPGAPGERAEFWSKPILWFWILGAFLRTFGVGYKSDPAEMVRDWRPEWACRLPEILLSLLALWTMWYVIRRLVSERVAAISVVVLATSSQWFLISRQAMTDMAFVAPMTIALALAALAILDGRQSEPLPRRQWRALSWPDDRRFYVFVALFTLVVIPQLIAIAAQVQFRLFFPGRSIPITGALLSLPYGIGFVCALWWVARARRGAELLLFTAYLCTGIATLAKGPAGIGLPAIVIVVFLVLAGRGREILTRLDLPRGILIAAVVTLPWYHAIIGEQPGFWREFFFDDYLNRAAGRSGDRGSFEYYIVQLLYGTFPWTGLTLASVVAAFRWRGDSVRKRLVQFALVWLLVDFSIVAFVTTKFHHYILPALPAVAILTGVFLDELESLPRRARRMILGVAGLPVIAVAGDLVMRQARILWLFNYDYVVAPNVGRRWPDGYSYGTAIMALGVLSAVATVAIGFSGTSPPAASEAELHNRHRDARAFLVVAGVLTAIACFLGPTIDSEGHLNLHPGQWLIPAAIGVGLMGLVITLLRANGARVSRGLTALFFVATVWTVFVLDKMMVELSQHWTEKHVVATYYRLRSGPNEPLIVFQLYWRGENFYTKNEIFSNVDPLERTVFERDSPVEHLKTYIASHRHRRVFFLIESGQVETIRVLLPPEQQSTLKVVDSQNVKLALCVAQI